MRVDIGRRRMTFRPTVVLVMLSLALAADLAAARNGVQFAVEHDYEVYLVDSPTGALTRVLARTKRPSVYENEHLFDAWFQPSLSPDGTRIAAIRYRNYSTTSFNDPRLVPIQSAELVVIEVTHRSETIVHTLPDGRFERTPRGRRKEQLASPVWSPDGRQVFFLAGSQVMAYSNDAAEPAIVARLAPGASAGATRDVYTNRYLRLSHGMATPFTCKHSTAPEHARPIALRTTVLGQVASLEHNRHERCPAWPSPGRHLGAFPFDRLAGRMIRTWAPRTRVLR